MSVPLAQFGPLVTPITIILIIVCLYLVGLPIGAGAVSRAPEGFEDDEGFHAGRQPMTDEAAL